MLYRAGLLFMFSCRGRGSSVKLVQEFVHHGRYPFICFPPGFEWWAWSPLNLLQENSNKVLLSPHLCGGPQGVFVMNQRILIWCCKRWECITMLEATFSSQGQSMPGQPSWPLSYRHIKSKATSDPVTKCSPITGITGESPDCLKSKFSCHYISFPKWCRLDVHVTFISSGDYT